MTRFTVASGSLALAWLGLGCLGGDPGPLAEPGSLAFGAQDFAGESAPPDALPRRPRLVLAHPDGFGDTAEALFLLAGPPDSDLVADLERKPLSAERLARRVDYDLERAGTELMLVPRAALEPGAEYTLALGAWTPSARGKPLGTGPFVVPLRTRSDRAAGARVIAAAPADGAQGVGTNLQAAVIAFDGVVNGAAEGVWLEGPDGLVVEAEAAVGACSALAPEYSGESCVRLVPAQRLAPAAAHALVVGGAVRDGGGAPVGPFRAAFRTAGSSDVQAPSPLIVPCAIDEAALEFGCALLDDRSIALRVHADEAVVASLQLGDRQIVRAAPDGQLALRIAGLPADSALPLALALRDGAGNRSEFAAELRTTPALATLAITEVYPDPLGPEPQQEFVELWNFGARAVDLLGFSLSDRSDMPGEAFARSLLLPPQARALLVPDAFDALAERDPRPPPGALLVRVGKALASGGLRNAGERLFLRDAAGQRISAVPDAPQPPSGVCLVRVVEDPRSGEPGSFAPDPDGGCTPGR